MLECKKYTSNRNVTVMKICTLSSKNDLKLKLYLINNAHSPLSDIKEIF